MSHATLRRKANAAHEDAATAKAKGDGFCRARARGGAYEAGAFSAGILPTVDLVVGTGFIRFAISNETTAHPASPDKLVNVWRDEPMASTKKQRQQTAIEKGLLGLAADGSRPFALFGLRRWYVFRASDTFRVWIFSGNFRPD